MSTVSPQISNRRRHFPFAGVVLVAAAMVGLIVVQGVLECATLVRTGFRR
jgi:hypothetical protein